MRRASVAFILVVASVGWAPNAVAQEPKAPKPPAAVAPAESPVAVVSGAYAFRTYCASCHGVDGRGEGPLTDSLRFHPPDLTLIAKRHGGEFPTEKVVRIVDGRSPMKGHGGPDMPIWGDAFRNAETGYDDAAARAKVRGVVDYLKTLQALAK
ncbi:MAG TPA: cytochrome c [Vicinamibacteria bacterium]|nr:cytochrome c [Vicinamibacteria bacterium]